MIRNDFPVRTCVGCGTRERRADLVRFVARPRPSRGAGPTDGAATLVVDAGGAAPGRGAYLHHDEECWTKFAKRRGTIRSLRTAATPQARAALIDELRASGSLRG